MNTYKEAWLANIATDYAHSRPLQRRVMESKKKRKKISPGQASKIVSRQKAESMMIAGARELAKHAAQSQIKGKLGIGLRVGGRVGLRIIPVVGAAILAYDLYKAYEYLTQ